MPGLLCHGWCLEHDHVLEASQDDCHASVTQIHHPHHHHHHLHHHLEEALLPFSQESQVEQSLRMLLIDSEVMIPRHRTLAMASMSPPNTVTSSLRPLSGRATLCLIGRLSI